MIHSKHSKRRLYCIAAIATGVVLIACWMFAPPPLNTTEKQLVGTWSLVQANPQFAQQQIEFRPDRTWVITNWENTDVQRERPFVSTGSWKHEGSRLLVQQDVFEPAVIDLLLEVAMGRGPGTPSWEDWDLINCDDHTLRLGVPGNLVDYVRVEVP